MAKFILFLFTLLLPVTIFSQAIVNPVTSTEERFKSPQIHLLKEFVDHPVDLSRGLADVTIPIYNIKYADKTIPIKLMFHASGLKADVAENGMLGLKWALNIGGFISREVRGYPDERQAHKVISGSSYTPDWMTLYGGSTYQANNNNPIFASEDLGLNLGPGYNGIHGKYEDTEYDIFTFSLPNGEGGKFILKDNNGDKTAAFMPYKPYKLSNPVLGYRASETNFVKFEITDDQGYTYSFGSDDTTDTSNQYYESNLDNQTVKSWLLKSITSPNKKEIIKFEYISTWTTAKSTLTPVVINDYLENFNNYYFSQECGVTSHLFRAFESILYEVDSYFVTNYNQPPSSYDQARYLSKITYNNVSVNFAYTADNNHELSLSKIEVLNDNKIIQKTEFDVVHPAGDKPNYLNAVSIKGSTDQVIEKYNFDYYHLDKLPLIDKLSNSADYWGYYNSEVENVIQKDTIDVIWTAPICIGSGSAQQRLPREIGSVNDRYSKAEDMKIGMIKSITYPTGGTTIFDYESNQYKDNNVTRECGGLRIKSIIDKDKNGNELKKREFTYGENEDGIGKIPYYLKPPFSYDGRRTIRNAFEETKTQYFIDCNPEGPDIGTYTTRYITGFFPGNYYTFLYNLVAYDKVTEYYGDSNNNIGKIENYYSINIPSYSDYEFDYNSFTYQTNKYTIDPSNFWQNNYLAQKMEYKTKNGVYSKVKQTNYSYEDKIIDEFYDLSIFRYKTFVGYWISSGRHSIISAREELEQIIYNPRSYFGYKLQKYTIGSENFIGTTEETFLDDGKSIVQETFNKYDTNRPTFIKESATTTSKGDNMSQKFLYPFDINTGVYSQMTQANIISPLIEKVALKGDKVTGSTLLTYKKSDNNFVPDQNHITELNIPVPYSGFTNFNGSNKDAHYNANPENTYDLYDDYGNPKQITSKGKITTCYVWGYDKKYPIAKIENATYTTGLLNSITTAQQTLIDNVVFATIGENTLATEANLIAKLKLLRAGFPDAMVTTFTYDPLIGITSMTDPKEYTTYYEYDVFNRLKQVKDNEGKILSATDYHYRGQ